MNTDTGLFSRLPGGVRVRSLLALAVILLVAWLVVESPLFHKTAPPGVHLTDLNSVSQFQRLRHWCKGPACAEHRSFAEGMTSRPSLKDATVEERSEIENCLTALATGDKDQLPRREFRIFCLRLCMKNCSGGKRSCLSP